MSGKKKIGNKQISYITRVGFRSIDYIRILPTAKNTLFWNLYETLCAQTRLAIGQL